ncbi:MAG: hypothetical protein JW944_12615 [Deltaproteobacteria bacterium]|nr:hypothetical protein [Deltaproteobacteria bacterium]
MVQQMRKAGNILIFFISAIFLFGGCAINRGLTSRVTVTLVNYINQGILSIAELEKKSLERYASVTGKNYTTDRRIQDELRDFIIPAYERFADGLKTITPKDPEIQAAHAVYINAADLMLNGFRNKLTGIEQNNDNIIIEANRKIEKARDENEQWRKIIMSLYEKYGITEIDDNQPGIRP